MKPQPERVSSVGLIVRPLSADYETNNTDGWRCVKFLFELTLLVKCVLFTPLTVLVKFHLALHGLLVLAGVVILTIADATPQGY